MFLIPHALDRTWTNMERVLCGQDHQASMVKPIGAVNDNGHQNYVGKTNGSMPT